MLVVVKPVGTVQGGAGVTNVVEALKVDEPPEQTVCTCHSYVALDVNAVALYVAAAVLTVVHVAVPVIR